MTDGRLMDADCVHGVTWYECAECERADLQAAMPEHGSEPPIESRRRDDPMRPVSADEIRAMWGMPEPSFDPPNESDQSDGVWLPGHCAACGSADIFYDRADGWSCRSCGRSDADE